MRVKAPTQEKASGKIPKFAELKEGFAYALSRPVLLGTYLVDIVAMIFCYPMVLFPALASSPSELGPFYSAMSLGAFITTMTSAWTLKIKRHGAMITIAALGWAVFIAGFAMSTSYWIGLFFLVLAGFSDMVSAIFRSTIWNQTIPDSHRGRLGGIEMLSYMCGPLLGNTLLGYLATVSTPRGALFTGSCIAMGAIVVVTMCLMSFWRYRSQQESIR
jgi:hypothetical protein